MGYKRKRTVYKLVFDGELEGLEVCTYAPPLKILKTAVAMSSFGGQSTSELDAREFEQINAFFEDFAEYLVSWNLEDDDGLPVPATVEGLQAQDLPFVMEILEGWLDTVADVDAPLGQPSSSGRPPLEGSLPMEPLSPSLPSSDGLSSSSATANDSAVSRVS